MIRTPAAIIRDWWSDPAYRDTVALTLAGAAAWGLLLLWLHILGG
jgi:hypothetical protein